MEAIWLMWINKSRLGWAVFKMIDSKTKQSDDKLR